MGEKKTRTKYKNKYIKDNYDSFHFTAPKGTKDLVKRIAAEMDMSMNEYICTLIYKDTATGHSLMQVHKGLTEEQIAQLDRWQVPAKYRQMIESFSGNMTEGYVVKLKEGFINDETGGRIISVRTTKELRRLMPKTHAVKQ